MGEKKKGPQQKADNQILSSFIREKGPKPAKRAGPGNQEKKPRVYEVAPA